jgi:iron(III) transport system permease protein
VAIAYSSALIVLMLVAIWVIQMLVGERRLGRRTAIVAPAKVPGAAQLGTTAA